MGIGVRKKSQWRPLLLQTGMYVALVIIETVFLGRMGLHRGQQIIISVGIGQNFE